MNNLLALIDGLGKDLGQGGVIAISSIALVFSILGIIIVIAYVVGVIVDKKATIKAEEIKKEVVAEKKSVNVSDEDAMVAVLVASIDMRNETKKDVKLVSIKEIK